MTRQTARPTRSPWKLDAFGLGIATLVAICMTVAILSGWGIIAIVVVGATITFLWPPFGILLILLSDGAGWPALLLDLDFRAISGGSHLAGAVGLVACILRGRRPRKRVVQLAGLLVLLILPGALIAAFTLPPAQGLAGLRLFLIPLVVAVVASMLRAAEIRLIFKMISLLMSACLLFAIYQTTVGQSVLLATGRMQEGVNVRGIDGVLRAAGSFLTNYHMGAFAAVFTLVAILVWPRIPGAARDRFWITCATAIALVCLALSTYRTGVVVILVSAAVLILTGRLALPFWARIFGLLASIVLVLWFSFAGLASSASLEQRSNLWAALFSRAHAPLGNGLGYSGAASGASGAAERIVVDNYYLSLWLQFGVFGLGIAMLLIVIAVHLARQNEEGGTPRVLGAMLIGVLSAFALVDFWEYTSAMSLVGFALGAAGTVVHNRQGDGMDPATHPRGLRHPIIRGKFRFV